MRLAEGERSRLRQLLLLALGSLVAVVTPLVVAGQRVLAQGAPSEAELARKAQNPISSMISLPFESTFSFKNGEEDETQYVLQVQPVVPVGLGDDWNLITRPIIPLISQPDSALLPSPPIVTTTGSRTFGLGDVNLSFFFSPSTTGNFTWGAGPVFLVPTATDDALGAGQWAAGPTAVGLYQGSNWSVGSLVGQLWTYAGDSSRDAVTLTFLQPFANYNLADGWYLTTSPILSANWEAESDQVWTVPVGAGVGKIFAIGGQSMNARVNAYYNAIRPNGASTWQLQLTLQFLFPR